MSREIELQNRILQNFGALDDVRLFRNNVGKLPDRTGRIVTYGLCRGSSDLIGLVRRESCGCGRFLAAELKGEGGRSSPEQRAFVRMVQAFGGAAGIVHSEEEMRELIEGARK